MINIYELSKTVIYTILAKEYLTTKKEIKRCYSIKKSPNSNVYIQVIKYKNGSVDCACDKSFLTGNCSHKKEFEKLQEHYDINQYISVKLIDNFTVLYVNDEEFIQCRYLLLVNPQYKETQDLINSIDEIKDLYDSDLEQNLKPEDLGITPEQEFWGHCSNLEIWVENNYDTRLLHSNISFPLLRKLADIGDPLAKRVFKDEVLKRIDSGYENVIKYLLIEGFISSNYFNKEELETIYEIIGNDFLDKIIEENENARDIESVINMYHLITEDARNRAEKLQEINALKFTFLTNLFPAETLQALLESTKTILYDYLLDSIYIDPAKMKDIFFNVGIDLKLNDFHKEIIILNKSLNQD